jgi:hypothetical protein
VNDAVTVRQAFRFAVDPTPLVEGELFRHAGAARFGWRRGGRRARRRPTTRYSSSPGISVEGRTVAGSEIGLRRQLS